MRSGTLLARGLSLPLFALAAGLCPMPLEAQNAEQRDPTIANLPRPGYEPRTIILGGTVIAPTLDMGVTYDNNILAVPDRTISDAIFTASPKVLISHKGPTFDLRADLHGSIIRYMDHPTENVNTFGATIDATKGVARNQTITAELAFDRTFERRSDPEASINRTRSPALINLATALLRYNYAGPRVGLTAEAAISKLDYLPLVDADRDMLTYRASVRGSVNVGRRVAVFVQPFVNRRDFRLKPVRGAIFGDATTMGVLGGISFDLADKLQGDIGLGAFRSNPDAPGVKSFTGLAANGRIVWRPRVRTAVIFEVFRGDVATIRAGSLGRIDTRIGLAIDQEVRHNLQLHGSVGLRDIHYRGAADNDQRYVNGEIEMRYLFSRHWSLSLGTAYTKRTSPETSNRFDRWQTTLGLRLVY
ncbi:outer membrane beta-barrel protein [Flavisphingomonas formosensis]|uniref:outer membrane beta-barrel protein n=1 Tax=Flavisphingomonas formosensis TaxID=861534 RepID=UPI0012FAE4FD|nr:outer membrane beta-barrel protein [Sphingomonas formosensis]